MNTTNVNRKGFSLIEVLIVLAIMAIISAITMYSYNTLRERKSVETTIDAIDFRLEEARTNAISGKGGSDFGIQFGTSTYTYFTGSTYTPSDSSNLVSNVNGNVQISKSFADSGSSIIFTRITGIPQTTGTITVTSLTNASSTASITIGTLGDISVVK